MGLYCVSVILCILSTVFSQSVIRPPKIEVFIGDTRFRAGADKYQDFVCIASGNPEPNVQWERNGAPYDFSGTGAIPIDGGYRIRGPGKLNEGKYQCFARNSHGTAMSTIASLTRAYIEDYQEKPSVRNYEVQEGNSLQMYVRPLASNPAPTYTWSRATDISDKYPTPIRPDRRRTLDDNGNLMFVYTEPGDGGARVYKCDIRNPVVDVAKGGSSSRVTVLSGRKTHKAPKLMFQSGPVVQILEGVPEVTLRCIFSGYTIHIVYWSGDLPQDHTTANHLFTIKNPKVQHSGTYNCRASNSAGRSQTKSIQLKVEMKPRWIKQKGNPMMPMDLNVTDGENGTFVCEGEGVPMVTRSWYINARPAALARRPNVIISGRHLAVINATKSRFNGSSDLMNVQCVLENTHGKLVGGAYLNVLERTRIVTPPRDVHLVLGEPVSFDCVAVTDPSTPVIVEWLWNNRPLRYDRFRYRQPDSSLRIMAEDTEHQGSKFTGRYTCVANNGYSEDRRSAELIV